MPMRIVPGIGRAEAIAMDHDHDRGLGGQGGQRRGEGRRAGMPV